jgi:hypothetical protein
VYAQSLWSGYGRSKKDFAQAMLGTAEEAQEVQEGDRRRHGHAEEADPAAAEALFNCAMVRSLCAFDLAYGLSKASLLSVFSLLFQPLEPAVPAALQDLHMQCAGLTPGLAP